MQYPYFDLLFTASSQESVDTLQTIISDHLCSRSDVPERMDALIINDPEMPSALCLQAFMLKLAAHPNLNEQITALQHQLSQLKHACNHREQLHISALDAWVTDQSQTALGIFEHIVSDYPEDIIALRMAHYLHFYNGRGDDMHASTGRAIGYWSESHPHYGFLCGMHAFGLEEDRKFECAEHYGRLGVDYHQADLWSIHAVDHVMYSQGRHEEGLTWLNKNRQSSIQANNFRFHLNWHEGIHQIELGNFDAALGMYDEHLAASINDDFYLDMCNNVALLWRLEISGVNVGKRWNELAEVAYPHQNDCELLFATAHYQLAVQRVMPDTAMSAYQSLQKWGTQDGHGAHMCRELGLDLAAHILELPNVARKSEITPSALEQIGGSRAQRELFESICTTSPSQMAQIGTR